MAEASQKLKVYAETTFFSYLTGRLTMNRLVTYRQMLTRSWWSNVAPLCEVFVSQYVIAEAKDGDSEQADKRLSSIAGVSELDGFKPEVIELARKLIDGFAVPKTEGADALHIATAAYYGMDVLLTWNCKHMANPFTLPKTKKILEAAGFACPNVTTPERFMEDQENE